MKVSELGQFPLIDIVAKMIQENRDDQADSWKNLITGIGDDCAVWRSETTDQLAKVDCQVEGIHFNLAILSWEELGWKSLAVNLSDIAAMGGIPRYALVSLGLPRETDVEDVVSLYRGMLKLARQTGTAIVGGNMSRSPVVFVDVNVLGITGNPDGKFLARSTAQPGDHIAVTGWLGTSAAGLTMLKNKLKFNPPVTQILKQAFALPEPRLIEGRLLVEKGVKTGIDISDGLLADLGHICQASHMGAILEVARIPIRDEVQDAFGSQSLEMAIAGGEDYQLLFTAKPSIIERVKKSTQYPVSVIGKMVVENPGQVILLDREGKHYQSAKTGWDHFKSTSI